MAKEKPIFRWIEMVWFYFFCLKSKKILKKLPRSKNFVLGLEVESLNKIGDQANKMIELTAAEIASLAFSGAVQATGGALSQTAIAKCKQLKKSFKEIK